MLYFVKHEKKAVTDSGGLQKTYIEYTLCHSESSDRMDWDFNWKSQCIGKTEYRRYSEDILEKAKNVKIFMKKQKRVL